MPADASQEIAAALSDIAIAGSVSTRLHGIKVEFRACPVMGRGLQGLFTINENAQEETVRAAADHILYLLNNIGKIRE